VCWLGIALAGCGDARLPLLSGKSVDIKAHQGDWLLLNYWATWCAPCVKEVPELNALDAESGIRVLGINFDNLQGDALRQAVSQLQIEFDQLLQDPAEQLALARPNVLPVTVIISPDGSVLQTMLGPQSQASIHAFMQRHHAFVQSP